MPLYELYRMTKDKLDSKEKDNTRATDQSSAPENDFFELVWDNGQISMQSKSSRARKSPVHKSVQFQSHSLPSHSPRTRDKDVIFGVDTRMGKLGHLDSEINKFPMSVPSYDMNLSQDEDMVHWLNYPMDDSLQHDYSFDFTRDVSGVTVNEFPAISNNCTLLDKRSNGNQVCKDSHRSPVPGVLSSEQANLTKGEVGTSGSKENNNQSYLASSQQCLTSFASNRPIISDTPENNISNAILQAPRGEITQIPPSSSGLCSLNMQKQDPSCQTNSSNMMNFSHFARPAAMVRANLQSISMMSGLSSVRSESLVTRKIDVGVSSSNPPESTLVDLDGQKNCQKLIMDPSKAELKPANLKSFEQKADFSKQFEPACKEDCASKNDQISNQVATESGNKSQPAVEKGINPEVASSSICSGNGVKRGSDNANKNLKRKSPDTEDSEYQSEEVEEESVGIKKAAHARFSSSKRSRAAEVHNLSERRRRDRINEKMRALQELIPNCNKVDKASMLDEAIEYLKTLQLQVQIMSMGAGLYAPPNPMMLHAGMQHMQTPHMASFSPLGIGMQMGLGMGYGVRTSDMNSGPPRFPMVQVPQMQGTHFPVFPIHGPSAALHGMSRSSPQVLGFPGQGLYMPMPNAQGVSMPGGPRLNPSTSGQNAFGAVLGETVDSASASSLKDPMPNVNSQVMPSTGCSNSTMQMSTQCEATNVGIDQTALVHASGHTSNINDSGSTNPGKEDNLVIGQSCND